MQLHIWINLHVCLVCLFVGKEKPEQNLTPVKHSFSAHDEVRVIYGVTLKASRDKYLYSMSESF